MIAPGGGLSPTGPRRSMSVGKCRRSAVSGLNSTISAVGETESKLPQRSNVIQHPEGASMGRGNQVVAMDFKIVNRHCRQVQLQRLPVAAIIHGKVNAGLRSRIEQAFAFGVFPDGAHVGTFRNAIGGK